MSRQNLLCRFLKDEGGTTIVEFALVSTIFFMLFLGIIEYGLIMFTKIAIESATQEVSRSTAIDAAVTGCGDRVCAVKTLIAQKTAGIVNPTKVLVTSSVVSNMTTPYPPEPDVCFDNYPADPYPATCLGPFSDNNGIGGYQANAINTGATDDLVQIRVFYTWDVMFPLLRPFFTGGVYKIISVTVVKNEPF